MTSSPFIRKDIMAAILVQMLLSGAGAPPLLAALVSTGVTIARWNRWLKPGSTLKIVAFSALLPVISAIACLMVYLSLQPGMDLPSKVFLHAVALTVLVCGGRLATVFANKHLLQAVAS